MSEDNKKPAALCGETDRKRTIIEQAKYELRSEREKEAVYELKEKLAELKAAKLMVRNIEKEIEDLEEEIVDRLDV